MSTCIIHPHPNQNQILTSPGTTKPIPDLQLDLDSIHQCTYLYINTTKLHDLNLRLVSQPPKYTRDAYKKIFGLRQHYNNLSRSNDNRLIIPQQTMPLWHPALLHTSISRLVFNISTSTNSRLSRSSPPTEQLLQKEGNRCLNLHPNQERNSRTPNDLEYPGATTGWEARPRPRVASFLCKSTTQKSVNAGIIKYTEVTTSQTWLAAPGNN